MNNKRRSIKLRLKMVDHIVLGISLLAMLVSSWPMPGAVSNGFFMVFMSYSMICLLFNERREGVEGE